MFDSIVNGLKVESEYEDMVHAGQKDRKGLEAAVLQGNVTQIGPTIAPTTTTTLEEQKKSSPNDMEENTKSAYGWKVYGRYVNAAGGLKITVAILLIFALNMGLNTFSSWWLSFWFNNGSQVSLHIQWNNLTVTWLDLHLFVPYLE